PTTAPHPLSLHAALPISPQADAARALRGSAQVTGRPQERPLAFSDAPGLGDEDDGWREARRSEPAQARPTSEPPSGGAMLIDDADRKSTRLNSSHVKISY